MNFDTFIILYLFFTVVATVSLALGFLIGKPVLDDPLRRCPTCSWREEP